MPKKRRNPRAPDAGKARDRLVRLLRQASAAAGAAWEGKEPEYLLWGAVRNLGDAGQPLAELRNEGPDLWRAGGLERPPAMEIAREKMPKESIDERLERICRLGWGRGKAGEWDKVGMLGRDNVNPWRMGVPARLAVAQQRADGLMRIVYLQEAAPDNPQDASGWPSLPKPPNFLAIACHLMELSNVVCRKDRAVREARMLAPGEDKLMTFGELAEEFGVSVRTLRKWRKDGRERGGEKLYRAFFERVPFKKCHEERRFSLRQVKRALKSWGTVREEGRAAVK